jgi:putative phosphoesterase
VRVAALYDVHGNLPALEAVLAEVETVGVDLVVFGGDVALGPLPNETIAALRALGDRARFVRGNTDRGLVRIVDGALSPENGHLDEGWVAECLSRDDRDFLASFEEQIVLDVDGLGATRFCHGSPRSDEEILTRLTSEKRLARVLAGVEERAVVCGHTHSQFDRTAGAIRVINPGSVGMPYEAEPGAYWAVLGPGVELRRAAYDLARAAERIRASGWPAATAWIAENLLRVPTAEEAAERFELLAVERDRAG